MCPENKDTFLLLFLCLCAWCACVYGYVLTCVGLHVCTQRPQVFFSLPQLFFPVIQWRRVSKSKPELTDMASLTSCLALGIPCLHLQAWDYRLAPVPDPTCTLLT